VAEAKPDLFQYSIASLLDQQFAPDSWWVPHFVPKGGLTLIGGPKKIGKSWVLNNLVRCSARGDVFMPGDTAYPDLKYDGPGGELWVPPQCAKARVLLIDVELGIRTLQARMNGIMRDDLLLDHDNTRELLETQMFYLSRPSKGGVAVSLTPRSEGFKRMWGACEAIQPNIIIMDPVSMMHDYDEDSNTEIQKLIHTIQSMSDKLAGTETSIIICHHFKKPNLNAKDHDPLDINNFRGASKFADAADSIIAMDRLREPDDTHMNWNLHLRVTGRHGPGTPRLQIGVNYKRDGRIHFRKVLD
jgi:hypothetical protein